MVPVSSIPIPAKFQGRAAVSPEQAGEVLGISRSTIYRRVMPAVYSGQIQSLKIGGARRIVLISLLAWAEAHLQEIP